MGELILGIDGDSLGVVRTRQFGGIAASFDIRDLGRGEGDDSRAGVLPVSNVEVMEIPPGGPHDEHTGLFHVALLPLSLPSPTLWRAYRQPQGRCNAPATVNPV